MKAWMKAWLLAAGVVAALAISTGAARAYTSCGEWGGTAFRCLGSNGPSPRHPMGQGNTYYGFYMNVKPDVSGSFKMKLSRWSSYCLGDWRGLQLSSTTIEREAPGALIVNSYELVGWHMCMEYEVDKCEAPIGTPRACADIFGGSMRERPAL